MTGNGSKKKKKKKNGLDDDGGFSPLFTAFSVLPSLALTLIT